MATREAKERIRRSANAIRKALPDIDSLSAALCESGYGLKWNKLPPAIKKAINRDVQNNLYFISGLMAREPEILRQANEAKI